MNTPVVICETDVLHAAKALSSPPWYGEFVIEADGEVIEFVTIRESAAKTQWALVRLPKN